jgi:hypothetical protein
MKLNFAKKLIESHLVEGEILGGHPKPANEGHLKTGQR